MSLKKKETKFESFRKINELFDVLAEDVLSTFEKKKKFKTIEKIGKDRNFFLDRKTDRCLSKNLDFTYSKRN